MSGLKLLFPKAAVTKDETWRIMEQPGLIS